MNITKFGHSCVRVENEGRVLVLDPGTFSDVPTALAGAEAVLVTHEHADHLDRAAVMPLLAADASLLLYAPAGLAAELRAAAPELGAQVIDVGTGADFEVAGMSVRAFGGQHAVIHSLLPVVANLGYLIQGNLFHPGDSFVVPEGVHPETLLIPLHAPWSNIGATIDYLIAMRCALVLPIHDGLLNETGLGMLHGHLGRFGARYGSVFEAWAPGDSREL